MQRIFEDDGLRGSAAEIFSRLQETVRGGLAGLEPAPVNQGAEETGPAEFFEKKADVLLGSGCADSGWNAFISQQAQEIFDAWHRADLVPGAVPVALLFFEAEAFEGGAGGSSGFFPEQGNDGVVSLSEGLADQLSIPSETFL